MTAKYLLKPYFLKKLKENFIKYFFAQYNTFSKDYKISDYLTITIYFLYSQAKHFKVVLARYGFKFLLHQGSSPVISNILATE